MSSATKESEKQARETRARHTQNGNRYTERQTSTRNEDGAKIDIVKNEKRKKKLSTLASPFKGPFFGNGAWKRIYLINMLKMIESIDKAHHVKPNKHTTLLCFASHWLLFAIWNNRIFSLRGWLWLAFDCFYTHLLHLLSVLAFVLFVVSFSAIHSTLKFL